MSTALWISFLTLTALGAALIALFAWQRVYEAVLRRQREELRRARMALMAEQAAYEAGRRLIRKRPQQAFLCLNEVKVEQRYLHSQRLLRPGDTQRILLRERITFRDFALSHWLEQEVPLQRGDDLAALAKAVSIFSGGVLNIDSEPSKAYVEEILPVPLGAETALAAEAALPAESVAKA
ncbi:MAG TPA: hypothetical protein VML01_05460 [Bryobacterales bacterium]|nr:hypothetical protein [Bryobacterales bacterium]